jgi:hypothetical protein
VDAVGNEGPTSIGTYELDRAAPAPAAFSTTPASPGHDPDPVWAFLYEPGATAWCSLDDQAAVPCEGTFAASALADGDHLLTVTVVDDAGNVSEPASSTISLDTVAPAAPVLTAPRSPGRDVLPEWLIEVEPGAIAECSLDGDLPVACASVFTADLTGRDGPHQLVVTARDPAGNLSDPVLSAYLLDTVAPPAPVIVHTPDATAWVWRFTIEPAASAECSSDGAPWAACTSPVPGGVPDRPVRFEVRATDRAGNRSPVTRVATTPTKTVAVPPAPPAAPPPPPAPAAPSRGFVPSVDVPPPPAFAPPAVPASVARPATEVLLPEVRLGDRAVFSTQRPTMRDRGLFNGPVRELLEAAAHSTTIPMLVVLVVLAFVAVQNRIDRLDPKLADAPLRHEPEYLEFE